MMKTSSSQEPASLLGRCGPLSDPVTMVGRTLLWTSTVSGLVLLAPLARDAYAEQDRIATGSMAVVAALLAVQMLLPLAIWLLIRKPRKLPVFFLRAFRSDSSGARLHCLLRAAFGPGHRLCGIRQPRARSNPATSLLFPVVTALRYAGSEFFELEAASHNWMARLLASYARARFAFVDIRNLTPHVENEIRLTVLAFGPDRCIFITDPGRGDDEWIALLLQAAGGAAPAGSKFRLLSYPGDGQVESKAFVAAARSLCAQVPEGPVGVSGEAVAFARGFVSDDAWNTPVWETDRGTFVFGLVASLAAGVLIGFAAYWVVPESARLSIQKWMGPVVNGWALCFYCVGWIRAWRQARSVRASGGDGERGDRGFRLLSLVLAGVYVAIALLFFLRQPAVERQATVGAARVEMMGLEAPLTLYAVDHGGFPSTSEGLSALLSPPVGPDGSHHESYIRGKTRVPLDPWGREYRYRCPGERNPDKYDLWSAGPDGVDGTGDDVVDR